MPAIYRAVLIPINDAPLIISLMLPDRSQCTTNLLKISKAHSKAHSRTLSTKRPDYLSWQDYFMSSAFLAAMRSKDPNTQVGS